ncbi:MAG: dihydroneopterin aldolase [Pseudomonadota bacterium]
MSSYKITLKNCAFFARHGVYNEEETLGQRFFVDAVLDVNAGDALEKDEIEGTVDYGTAFKVIETIITGKRRFLIEALALEVARAICKEFPMVTNADITIRKPNAPVQGVLDHVEVTISHCPGN